MTTARMLAEHVLQLLRPYFPDMKAPWTHASPLPGGNFLGRTLQSLQKEVAAHYPFVPKACLTRWIHQYGMRVWDLLADIACMSDLGACLQGNLYEAEVNFLRHTEWAICWEDVLWRRTQLGVYFSRQEREQLMKIPF